MDTPTDQQTLPGEQPDAQPQGGNQNGEQPSEVTLETISALPLEERIRILEAAENPQPQERSQPATPSEPADGEQPPAGEEVKPGDPDQGTQPSKPAPKRISLRSLPDEQRLQVTAALDLVEKGQAKDIATAFAMLATPPDNPKPAKEPEQPENQQPAAETTQQPQMAVEVSTIKDRIAELREQRKQAKSDFDVDAEEAITGQIEDLQLDLLRAEQAEKETARQVQNYQQAFRSKVAEAEERYPDLLDDDSAFSRILDDKVLAARARNDKALADPSFIVAFADEVAQLLGVRGGKPDPKTQAATGEPARIPNPPARTTRPVGSALAPGTGVSPRLSHDDARRLIQSASKDELEAVLFDH